MGGAGKFSPTASRELTEIEKSLLGEVVQILAAALARAWEPIVLVEFEVETLSSDPLSLSFPAPQPELVRAAFTLQFGEQAGGFELAVPRALLETAGSPGKQSEDSPAGPSQPDLSRNLRHLEDAQVHLEVRLHGPTLAVNEILALKAGQVITFDYSLEKALEGMVNDEIAIQGHIVSIGRKRAFQVEQLPAANGSTAAAGQDQG
jgi:flagellar motor switch protein FliM